MRTRLTCVVATFDLAPLQRRRGTGFPGLKPRAEPSRPLRGEEASLILINLAPFNLSKPRKLQSLLLADRKADGVKSPVAGATCD
jgi:hypothetical protein